MTHFFFFFALNEFLSTFHSTCAGVLDSIAPLRQKTAKPRTAPRLNDTTRVTGRHCRKERRRKKDKLHVTLEMLRTRLADYQRPEREANSQYLSNIISASSHCPKVLFETITAVVNPCICTVTDVSTAACENFELILSEAPVQVSLWVLTTFQFNSLLFI